MFIEQDEHIIIMEDMFNTFKLEDLKRLEDAGMKTMYLTSAICWDKIYQKDTPERDWSSLDSRIEIPLQSNFKLLLPFYYTMPDWFADEWYIKKHELADHIMPRYGNKEFQQAVDTFAEEVLDRLSPMKDRIQLTYSIPAGGEFLWDSTLTVRQFPVPLADVNNFVVGRQRMLSKQHGEMWSMFHNFLGVPDNWNNKYLPALYQELIDTFPDIPLYSIQAAHFWCGDRATHDGGQIKVKEYSEKFGIKFFVGSEYCEGLVRNFDRAVSQNVYGFFTALMHFVDPNHRTSVEPWMIENLKEANRKLQEIWNDRNSVLANA